MPNQFTKAQDKGLEPGDDGYPAGANQFTTGSRTEHPEDVRAKIRVGNIVARFEKIVAESDNETAVIAAGKVLLDKTISSLSSQDVSVREAEQETPEAQELKLRALISRADRALLSKLLGEHAKGEVGETSLQVVNE